MSRFLEEAIKRQLRNYYNECEEINEQLDEEEITIGDAEKAMILLDEKYAKVIMQEAV